jgi:proteasome accessory factor A
VRRRIFGLEFEHGVALRDPHAGRRAAGVSSAPPTLSSVARMLVPRVSPWDGAPHGVWLRNSAKVYVDLGDHPETTTPECRTPAEAVAHDTAALLWLGQRQQEVVDELGCPVQVLRDNGPAHRPKVSWGMHENYLSVRRIEFPDLVGPLGLHLATRTALFGAGRPLTAPDGSLRFEPSARHRVVERVTSKSTTTARPMLNMRDETHGDHHRWRRLHVICGDSILDRDALELQLASTHLVLRLVEETPEVFAALVLADPVDAFHRTGSTTDLSALHLTALGAKRSALDCQEALALASLALLEREGGQHWEWAAALEWQRWVDASRNGEALAPWARKLELLCRLEPRWSTLGPLERDARRTAFEMGYCDVAERTGWWWRHVGLSPRQRAAGQEASVQPPQTRAALRRRLLDVAEEARTYYTSDWARLVVGSHVTSARAFTMPDPFSVDPAVIAPALDFLADVTPAAEPPAWFRPPPQP